MISQVNQSTNQLINYTLHLADTALIMAQRNGEWCAHGPILEQDIAITNITLDQIGQARNLYQYAADIINSSGQPEAVTEDSLAYLRTEREFKNLLLAELPNGDWGQTVMKQYFYSVYQYLLYEQLMKGSDNQLSAISEKSIKELKYHVKWSSEWVIRLGDGTDESNLRMKKALDYLWMYTGEMFKPSEYELKAGVDLHLIKEKWEKDVTNILEDANLKIPSDGFMQSGGKEGRHTEHLGYILADLQYLQRTYPGAKW